MALQLNALMPLTSRSYRAWGKACRSMPSMQDFEWEPAQTDSSLQSSAGKHLELTVLFIKNMSPFPNYSSLKNSVESCIPIWLQSRSCRQSLPSMSQREIYFPNSLHYMMPWISPLPYHPCSMDLSRTVCNFTPPSILDFCYLSKVILSLSTLKLTSLECSNFGVCPLEQDVVRQQIACFMCLSQLAGISSQIFLDCTACYYVGNWALDDLIKNKVFITFIHLSCISIPLEHLFIYFHTLWLFWNFEVQV